MTDIYTNTSAFGLMSKEMQEAMQQHYEGGGSVEAYTFVADTLNWWPIDFPAWHGATAYRAVRPAPKPKPMTVPWDAIKPEYICAARDKFGAVFCYAGEPDRKSIVWEGNVAMARIDHLVGYDPGEVDWKDSLIWRPGFEPKG